MSLVRNDFDFQGVNFECWALLMPDRRFFFKLKELAKVLGYANVMKAYHLIDEKWKFAWSELVEREGLQSISLPHSKWQPSTIFISESGLYSLIFRSHKPEAVRFRHYVFEDILPEIRKKGGYISPNATTSQLNSLVESLQEQLAEKDRVLEESRAAVMECQAAAAEKERILAETRGILEEKERTLEETVAEKERTLAETRGMLEESMTAVTESQAVAEEKGRMLNEARVILSSEMHEKNRLQNNLQTVRPKVAVIPDRESRRHTLTIYRYGNIYKFIRTQKRSLKKARRRVPERFRLVRYFDEVPNALNIVNRLKEVLPQKEFGRCNTITSDADVVQLVDEIVECEINRPIKRKLEELSH